MRYDADHKTRTHRRIVRSASRQIRAKGLNGPGVAALMKASGLTHGGFYKHFRSKNELLAEAIEDSLREGHQVLLDAAKKAPSGEGWKAIVNSYLSLEHCDQTSAGCPIAALSPDIARTPPGVKRRIADVLKEYREAMLPWMPGRNVEERGKNFFVVFSTMIGAVSFARMMPEPDMRRRVLDSVRDYLFSAL
jgi:TetR/AcrR family transcriptional regulator, transcriptional repressor for nem operon